MTIASIWPQGPTRQGQRVDETRRKAMAALLAGAIDAVPGVS